jgi:IS30 family transposase
MDKDKKLYQQLNEGKRHKIEVLRREGFTLSAIGEIIHVSKSTVSRELRRNSEDGFYDAESAQSISSTRKSTAEKANKKSDKTDQMIREKIELGWSPETLSVRMKEEDLDKSHQLSHTTIYRRIEENKKQGGTTHCHLPHFGKSRWKGGKRKRNAGVGCIPNRVDISDRPDIVENRERLGDWEGDTVYGQNASLVTLVDRTSRFTLVKRVFSKCKEVVADAMIDLLGTVHALETLTLDNGGEFADHVRVSEETGLSIFFAKPYASWQRGTNENTNGRLRRFWPKKFDMATLTEKEINDRVLLLNITPRKILGGLTPFEFFTGVRVALIA